MAPTRPCHPLAHSPQSITSSSPRGSTASCSISKAGPGRKKNHWTSSRKRKAIRLYLFTTLNKDEIGKVLGGGFCKSDNERRIRELFLKGEVPSRSTWCKQNALGHQKSVDRWAVFEQYKVQPWRISRQPQQHQSSTLQRSTENSEKTSHTRFSGFQDEGQAVVQQKDHLESQKREEHDAVTRIHEFGAKYLPPQLSSVARVYCHSVTSSIRTSWISLTSTFRSSRASSVSTEVHVPESPQVNQGPAVTLGRWRQRSLRLPSRSILTHEEQSVWDLLIDDDQFRHDEEGHVDIENIEKNSAKTKRALLWKAFRLRKVKPPPIPSFLAFEHRPCRNHDYLLIEFLNIPSVDDSSCPTCGCSALQYQMHITRTMKKPLNTTRLNWTDFYHNTALFYYATNPLWTVPGLKMLIEAGADIMIQNASGESFLHCLIWSRLGTTAPKAALNPSKDPVYDPNIFNDELIDLLEYLAARKFPFSHCDEHGRTVGHLIFQHMYRLGNLDLSIEQLDRILTALNVDIDGLDNQGNCIGQYLDIQDQSRWKPKQTDEYQKLLAKVSISSSFNSSNLMLDLKQMFISATLQGQSWPVVIETLGYSSVVDSQGDTPLTAMLKLWNGRQDVKDRYGFVEGLLKLGTVIDTKDRRGNTALLIAARRGFRSTVEQLLRHGANPNVINYSERSVMFMSKGWLKIAKRLKDDQQYAWIASCIPVIQDAQAVFEPSSHRQRLSVETRSQHAKGQLQISDDI